MSDVRETAAQALMEAERTGAAIEPLTKTFPELTIADAYAIQVAQVERRVCAGARVKGHKVGLSSFAMQQMLGVDRPDFGHILDEMVLCDGSVLPMSELIAPRIEPEIALVLGSRLDGPWVTTADAIQAVSFVLPAMELIDSRIRDWQITIVDTIADNASCGRVILGNQPTPLDRCNLRLAGCSLVRNGEIVATGAGGAVLGSPINALVWLANTLAEFGVSLEAGQVIMPGSLTSAIGVSAGDVISADFGALGSVTAIFGEG